MIAYGAYSLILWKDGEIYEVDMPQPSFNNESSKFCVDRIKKSKQYGSLLIFDKQKGVILAKFIDENQA